MKGRQELGSVVRCCSRAASSSTFYQEMAGTLATEDVTLQLRIWTSLFKIKEKRCKVHWVRAGTEL
jgi:hypothetical protein